MLYLRQEKISKMRNLTFSALREFFLMKTSLQQTDNCFFKPTRKGRIINGNIYGLQMEEFLLEKVTTALPFK